ncbi:MAG: DUF1592 domain-containing protein [Nannocystaceae bacterium]
MTRRRARWRGAGALVLSLGLVATTGCRDDGVEATGSDDDDGSGSGGAAETEAEPGQDGSGSTGGQATDGSDDDPGDDTGEPEPQVVPPPGGVRRLLAHQYIGSIDYLLGPEAAAAAIAPDDPSLGTFDALGTLTSVPSVPDLELYEASARAVAEVAVASPWRLINRVPCLGTGPFDETCYRELAIDFGRLAWRRPLTEAQVDRLVAVAEGAQQWSGGEFMPGVQSMLTAVLQSPYFVYLVELGEPGDGPYRELTGLELATRMSFFLTGRTPSDEVLALAQLGELDDDESVRELAWQLLQEPSARDTVWRFFRELLMIDGLPGAAKDAELFPTFSPQLAASMAEETRLLVDDVVFTSNESILRLFDSSRTYVDDDLAALYGMGPVGGGWQQVPMPAGRAGVLSQAGWLSMTSHNTVNSPTRRGLYVMEQLLCAEVPLPPPRVNPEPIIPEEGQTLRESLQQHVQDPACSGCHLVTDPIGFGFEHMNPIGAWQHLDNGQPVDASGSLPGVGAFYGANGLAAMLVQAPELPRCLVDKLYAGSLGTVPDAGMVSALDAAGEAYAAADYDFKQLMVELTVSPVFRLVDEPK